MIGIANDGGIGVGALTDATGQPGMLALNTALSGAAIGHRAETHSSGDGSVGVLGTATSTTGRTDGVRGTTGSPDGYGLATPDDARVGGVAELDALGGSLTGGSELTNVAGENLSTALAISSPGAAPTGPTRSNRAGPRGTRSPGCPARRRSR